MIQINPNSPPASPESREILHDLRRQDREIQQLGACIDRLAKSINDAVHEHQAAHLQPAAPQPSADVADEEAGERETVRGEGSRWEGD